jgi:hypothetical protein
MNGGTIGMETQPTLQFDVAYPERLSRLLIFVKWLLVIPHLIVLLFLGIGWFFATLIAWIAILITGNYPRSLFDFSVMVLQWTARVYSYGGPWWYVQGALLTDDYPPFGEGNHPANLTLGYPPRLSRVLNFLFFIKWILLIPHFIVLFFLQIAAFVVSWIAFFAILFTARYPRGLFDFVIGYYRWTFRVTAYAALMTDDYPPFGFEPSAVPGPPAEQYPAPQANF